MMPPGQMPGRPMMPKQMPGMPPMGMQMPMATPHMMSGMPPAMRGAMPGAMPGAPPPRRGRLPFPGARRGAGAQHARRRADRVPRAVFFTHAEDQGLEAIGRHHQ